MLVCHDHADAYREALSERLDARIEALADPGLDSFGLAALDDDEPFEVVLAWKVPDGAFEPLTGLRWLQCTGAGVDQFLGRADLGEDVLLTRSLGRFGIQAAEYVVGYLLSFLLDIERYRERQATREWNPRERPLLADRTVGIVGLGSLGLPVARAIKALGATVLGVRRSGGELDGVDEVYSQESWRAMLPKCQALVLAVPRTSATIGMIDEAALAAMPPGAVLINVARGELVDERALLEALESEHLGAAVLDVFEQEPLPPDHRLWDQPRAWITPHIAAPSEVEAIADEFAENYRRFVAGQPLLNVVDRERGY